MQDVCLLSVQWQQGIVLILCARLRKLGVSLFDAWAAVVALQAFPQVSRRWNDIARSPAFLYTNM